VKNALRCHRTHDVVATTFGMACAPKMQHSATSKEIQACGSTMTEYMAAKLTGERIAKVESEPFHADGTGVRCLVITFDSGRRFITEGDWFKVEHENGDDEWTSAERANTYRTYGIM
jgi:hypothetical protein